MEEPRGPERRAAEDPHQTKGSLPEGGSEPVFKGGGQGGSIG